LWSVPLSVLSGTQERPIFTATRRPPPRAGAPAEEAHAPPPPKPAETPPPTTANNSFAPFVPRAPPKNGEADGLSAQHQPA
jgi:hypothetical protein